MIAVTTRGALVTWMRMVRELPPGTEIEVMEEGATPGPGASMVIALYLLRDGTSGALAIRAGSYDGEPRVFAKAFQGEGDQLTAEVNAWKAQVDV